jgi:hypothetical protein
VTLVDRTGALLARRHAILSAPPRLPKWLRQSVINDAYGACWLCGSSAQRVGWIIAPHHGGAADHPHNLIAECQACASARADMDPLDFAPGGLTERQRMDRLRALEAGELGSLPPAAGRSRVTQVDWLKAHRWEAPRTGWLVDWDEDDGTLITPLALRHGQGVALGLVVLRACGAREVERCGVFFVDSSAAPGALDRLVNLNSWVSD